jgi:hypothetical protein
MRELSAIRRKERLSERAMKKALSTRGLFAARGSSGRDCQWRSLALQYFLSHFTPARLACSHAFGVDNRKKLRLFGGQFTGLVEN